jgi:quercetin dioxygenase-like cupin family protein
MMTRRQFTGVASCAICAAAGLVPVEASAQGATAGTQTPGLKRKFLSHMEGPMPGYVTIIAEVEIEPGATVARHTHPGIESGYVVAGGTDFYIQGKGSVRLKPGDGFQVPPETPHAGNKNGPLKTVVVSTYVVQKGKPLASPA